VLTENIISVHENNFFILLYYWTKAIMNTANLHYIPPQLFGCALQSYWQN